MKAIKIITIIFLLSYNITAQTEIEVNGMNFRYELIEGSVHCFLSAPTSGWLMVGFNDKNSTSFADFKFFAVVNDKAQFEDRKNIGGRNYPSDVKLKGENNIQLHYGKESNNRTSVFFSIPLKSKDINDFQHSLIKPFWLILAYSAEDDFEHHSLMRKHLPFQWEPK